MFLFEIAEVKGKVKVFTLSFILFKLEFRLYPYSIYKYSLIFQFSVHCTLFECIVNSHK